MAFEIWSPVKVWAAASKCDLDGVPVRLQVRGGVSRLTRDPPGCVFIQYYVRIQLLVHDVLLIEKSKIAFGCGANIRQPFYFDPHRPFAALREPGSGPCLQGLDFPCYAQIGIVPGVKSRLDRAIRVRIDYPQGS